ncbi:hypothetical protein Nepgr_032564 [Nepenthes gracilis]|uniref:Uncharacterized protein n=1 Tax=Nepenthes gracilis TaxID=150966 RepID=A0AAD3Y8E0_NEPGR|nr:hypothetical protein Nepgr_032564 [Nepenthes gracilis]
MGLHPCLCKVCCCCAALNDKTLWAGRNQTNQIKEERVQPVGPDEKVGYGGSKQNCGGQYAGDVVPHSLGVKEDSNQKKRALRGFLRTDGSVP